MMSWGWSCEDSRNEKGEGEGWFHLGWWEEAAMERLRWWIWGELMD